jgi:hypothetical protein
MLNRFIRHLQLFGLNLLLGGFLTISTSADQFIYSV